MVHTHRRVQRTETNCIRKSEHCNLVVLRYVSFLIHLCVKLSCLLLKHWQYSKMCYHQDDSDIKLEQGVIRFVCCVAWTDRMQDFGTWWWEHASCSPNAAFDNAELYSWFHPERFEGFWGFGWLWFLKLMFFSGSFLNARYINLIKEELPSYKARTKVNHDMRNLICILQI